MKPGTKYCELIMKVSVKIFYMLAVFFYQTGSSQDIHFSQFYATPLYLNPAFTGNTNEHRLVMNYRNQWPGISKAYVSESFSYDYNLDKLNSGFGILAVHDKSGSGGYEFTNVGFNYSYQAKITNKIGVNAGINFSYSIRDIDYSKLVFNDQLYRNSNLSFESQEYPKRQYLDIASGGLIYGQKSWLGFAAHHINKPNESLTGNNGIVPMKYSIHGGNEFKLVDLNARKSNRNINLAFNYRGQQKFDQLDLGFYYNHDPIVIGLWYRGIPLIKSYAAGYQNNDAIILMAGYEISQTRSSFRVGYSYDMTISRLSSNSAGSHEISLIYEFAQEKKRKRILVPCAKF